MKNNSFSAAMNKIVGQHEAELQQEIKAAKRAETIGRVRGIFVYLLLAAVLLFAYGYRDTLQAKIETVLGKSKPATTTDVGAAATGTTSTTVDKAQQNAETRDKIIDEISK